MTAKRREPARYESGGPVDLAIDAMREQIADLSAKLDQIDFALPGNVPESRRRLSLVQKNATTAGNGLTGKELYGGRQDAH